MTVATYAREFPEAEYAIDPMVLLRLSLMGFKDQSWHNNACPDFLHEKARMVMWIGPTETDDKVVYSLSRVDSELQHIQDDTALERTYDTFDEAVTAMIALRFADELHDVLDPPEFEAVRWLNALKYANDPQVCGSHDYCDANMIMADVFEQFGMQIPDDTNDLGSLWEGAWDIAKNEHLTAELPTRQSERT